ncbi:5504_t:CDS:2, partial [Diversispora eburnea]
SDSSDSIESEYEESNSESESESDSDNDKEILDEILVMMGDSLVKTELNIVKNTLSGQQFYPRTFFPDISFSQVSKLLQNTNIKFQYGTDFNSSFSYTLCSASTTSSEIEELKLSIIIENKQKNNTAKTLIISPVDFDNVIEKIHLYIQKSLGDRKLNVFDYSLQYKVLN